MKLSIIIPVFNEEKTIFEIIKKVKKVELPDNISKEIIVVNDASIDKTAEILKGVRNIEVISHKRNLGKGAAIKTGLKKATGDLILVQDADLEYNPEDYSRLIRPIRESNADVVYGSRLKSFPLRISGKRKTPLITHYLGNKFLSLVTRIVYGTDLSDMETCYKVFRKSIIKSIKLRANRFDFEPEITAKILKKGYKIYEVPIKVKPRGYDEGKKITWKDGFIAVWTLLKYRFID
ncbi:glycosyl transferase [Candidatus Woesebacteria bacterium RIFCSPHIGHO2_01_FULL_39_32]|uniref:Glycosyl transferase n=1 Tax=Candidatus Woesebacteria bacterium RIFCSPLOWO2_01_FULL_39_25 TaxID=1802521 RepID=A0A1F8BLL9_9BACT|nr:MAG: glycosyl transferase [Candidatus Woesebacteria bacterium GWB1_37_5]OGM25391.1 MAG: glycosyl transferase [Candidatus Woesebacteria bacterium RIFCSPHIGHO2_01_FULL_39_32]OGM38497.1 MAG: glycosyl transferase [Candidatus Woesebacteria bacterium RIFCSPHIGHO2_12_FULL_38_11]OGM64922.1 MAG: glycosyl transferase [Candidatus Woesebacteria bacterium RIFCSPLOWO2_01_FULL_39_25]